MIRKRVKLEVRMEEGEVGSMDGGGREKEIGMEIGEKKVEERKTMSTEKSRMERE